MLFYLVEKKLKIGPGGGGKIKKQIGPLAWGKEGFPVEKCRKINFSF